MAGPLPISTRQPGVALRERLHHHRGIVGGGPTGGRGRGRTGGERPLGDGPARSSASGDRFESGPQAAACAIQGRHPRNEGPAR